ncbi:MAG: hypothetical protein FWF77_08650 [Defluviitaleaceae bacterium]|nr:hypothetical protein [Defluviitaleaceae bacterium]
MKKFLILGLALVFSLAFLAACNQGEEPAANDPDTGAIIDVTTPEEDADAPDEAPEAPDTNDNEESTTDNNNDVEENEENEEPDDEEIEAEERAPVEIPDRPADVVYSLSTDAYFQNIPEGTRGSGEDVLTTEFLMNAGNPSFRVVENPEGNVALGITFREENWHGVDIVTPALGLDPGANSYQITIRGTVGETGNILISGGDSPYATLFSQRVQEGNFEATFVATDEEIGNTGDRGHMRVHSNNLGDITLYEIEIRRIARVEPTPPPVVDGNVVYSLATDAGFQSLPMGDYDTMEALLGDTPYLQNAGTPRGTIVENPHGGNAIRVNNRREDWHTIDIMTGNMNLNLDANTYTIRVTGSIVDAPEGSTVDIMGAESPWGRFNRPTDDNAGVPISGTTTFEATAILSTASFETNVAAEENRNRVRFAISGTGGDMPYTIYEIVVTRN